MIISANSDVSAMHLCKGAGGSGAISTVGDSFAPGTWSDWFHDIFSADGPLDIELCRSESQAVGFFSTYAYILDR